MLLIRYLYFWLKSFEVNWCCPDKKRQHKHLEFMIAPSQQSWSSLARVSLMSEVLLWEKPLLNKNVCFVKKEHWTCLNPHWHELWKQEKCSSLAPPKCNVYKTQWAWQGVKLTWWMSIFTANKVGKFLIKIQLTKTDPKRTRG